MLWEESLDFVKEAEIRSRILVVLSRTTSFDFLFGVLLGEHLLQHSVLQHSDNLSKGLQLSLLSAAEGQKVAAMMVNTLESLRTLARNKKQKQEREMRKYAIHVRIRIMSLIIRRYPEC